MYVQKEWHRILLLEVPMLVSLAYLNQILCQLTSPITDSGHSGWTVIEQ